MPASKGIATAVADRTIVAADHKAATRENVLKCGSSVDADLQHAAVKAVLKVKVVTKSYLHGLAALAQKNTG